MQDVSEQRLIVYLFLLWSKCKNSTKQLNSIQIKSPKQTRCGSDTSKFEYLQPSHLKADLNVPPMCFLSEGLLNWHNKAPRLQ